jgi:hypothetical protein
MQYRYSFILAAFSEFARESYPLLHPAKWILLPFRAKQKGASNHFKNCSISVGMCLLHETIPLKNKRTIMGKQRDSVLV